jgi:DNA-binding transcriptional ArsR family regulator
MQLTKHQINRQARLAYHEERRIVMSNVKLEMVKSILGNPGCTVDDLTIDISYQRKRHHLRALENAKIVRFTRSFIGGRMVSYFHSDPIQQETSLIEMPSNIYTNSVCIPGKKMKLILVDGQKCYLSDRFVQMLAALKVGASYNARQFSRVLSVPEGTAINYLCAMREYGLVERDSGKLFDHHRIPHGLLLDLSEEFENVI